ncbi:hypothetical protein C8R43DRAFT_997666 [Mycena crocata]|nr:hypothetical protein C8R43DRAFT_997666 [Mycena crocata]
MTDFISLPAELLLLLIDSLCFTSRIEAQKSSVISYSTRHIHPLSLVCFRLRQLCIPRLFCSLRCTSTQQLVLFKAKCIQDAHFARLIRKLDLANVESLDILASLLSLLKSLEWLDLDAEQVDPNLLAIVNTYPNLTTVAVRDALPENLRDWSLSTSSSLSKILLPSVLSDNCFPLECPALHALMSRRTRLAHLILCDKRSIRRGAGTLFLPGLEKLSIHLYLEPTCPMPWLPAFVERHPSLSTITYIGDLRGSIWRSNANLQFPLQFLDALEREDLRLATFLNAFTISRTSSASPLNEWEITAVEVTIEEAAGFAALRLASALAPRTSSLVIQMPRHGSRHCIRVDDLLLALGRFPSLQALSFRDTYRHFLFKGHLPPSDAVQNKTSDKTSDCMVANAALRWLISRVAQCSLRLELVDITDEGHDREGHSLYPWRLKAAYRVQSNRDLEPHGTPELVVHYRYKAVFRNDDY